MAACHLQDCDMGVQRGLLESERENGGFGALLKGFCSSLLPISELGRQPWQPRNTQRDANIQN